MASRGFDTSSFLIRWIVALVLVLGTFNPTQYSYYGWVSGSSDEALPFKALAGIILLIIYVIYLRATWRSIGPIGLTLATALFAAIVWVLLDTGILNLSEPKAITWALLVVFATILAIGLSWSHVRRRVSGQADMDDIDD